MASLQNKATGKLKQKFQNMQTNEHTEQKPPLPDSFEAGLKELEFIVEQMEQGQVPLDEAVKLYEQGVRLQQFCTQKLEAARLSIEKLSLDQQGAVTTKPFELNTESNL